MVWIDDQLLVPQYAIEILLILIWFRPGFQFWSHCYICVSDNCRLQNAIDFFYCVITMPSWVYQALVNTSKTFFIIVWIRYSDSMYCIVVFLLNHMLYGSWLHPHAKEPLFPFTLVTLVWPHFLTSLVEGASMCFVCPTVMIYALS